MIPGIVAGGFMGGGTPPGPTPVYGGIKIFAHYDSSGFGAALSEGIMPGALPSFDMVEMECTAIYQRYRVYDSGSSFEYYNLYGSNISGDYVVCYTPGGRYMAVTPYNKNATLKVDQTDWETNCTLLVGSSINLIDLGANRASNRATLIADGRFVPHMFKSEISDPQRTFTIYIVDFTSPTSHTLTPINVDLDDFSVPENFKFIENSGVTGVAFNHATGELSVAVKFTETVEGWVGYAAINVDADTGDINSFYLNIPSEPASTYLSPLAGLSIINYACFDDSFQFRAGQYDIGSFDSILMHSASFDVAKRTFTARGIDAPYNQLTNFADETFIESVSLDTAIANKLEDLGYEVINAIPSTDYHMSAIFEDMSD